MFWTTLKWGATAVLLVVFGLALWRAAASGNETPDGGPATSANPSAPPDNPPPKKFNF
ncbi:hypothetical protein [Ideonella sp.]|uniref:hypothetical protein n=1 Tax=Ideonella sp. TaxID=1929293 RepID=UPI0035B4A2E1